MEYRKWLVSCACSVLVFSQNPAAWAVAPEALTPVLKAVQGGDASGERSVEGLIASAEDSLSSAGEAAGEWVLSSEESLPTAEEFVSSEEVSLSSIEKVKEHYRDLRVYLESLIQEGTASDKLIKASKIRRDLIDILLLTEAPSLTAFQQAVLRGWVAYFQAYVHGLVEGVSSEAESLGERAQVHLSALKEASKEFKGFFRLLKGLQAEHSPTQ